MTFLYGNWFSVAFNLNSYRHSHRYRALWWLFFVFSIIFIWAWHIFRNILGLRSYLLDLTHLFTVFIFANNRVFFFLNFWIFSLWWLFWQWPFWNFIFIFDTWLALFTSWRSNWIFFRAYRLLLTIFFRDYI